MAKLKPCPFCGSKAEWCETNLPDAYSDHMQIACTNVACECAIAQWDGIEEMARIKWNRRAEVKDETTNNNRPR